eukprot:g25861.t1
MGPSYACLFIGYVEQSLFLCYINHCITAASCSHKEHEQIIYFTHTFHPNFKFTWIVSDTFLSILDLSVSISGNRLSTDIHFKHIDFHSNLNYTSSHAPSYENTIPYSQFLCLCCICSQDEAFHSLTSQMPSYYKD